MLDWILGVLLTLFIIIPCWLALARRRQVQLQVDAWPELARRTGLIFTPATYPVCVRGEYRGRYLSITSILVGDSDNANFPIYQNVSVSLRVRNYACFSLRINKSTHRQTMFKTTGPYGIDLDHQQRLHITGSPESYMQAVADRIARSDSSLLVWIKQNLPSIELEKEILLCWQNGELTDVNDQVAMLDLLCDLAELAEEIGKDYASSTQVAN